MFCMLVAMMTIIEAHLLGQVPFALSIIKHGMCYTIVTYFRVLIWAPEQHCHYSRADISVRLSDCGDGVEMLSGSQYILQ